MTIMCEERKRRRRRRSKNQDDEGKFFSLLYFAKVERESEQQKLSRCSSWDVYHKLNNKTQKGMTDFIKITAQYNFNRTKNNSTRADHEK